MLVVRNAPSAELHTEAGEIQSSLWLIHLVRLLMARFCPPDPPLRPRIRAMSNNSSIRKTLCLKGINAGDSEAAAQSKLPAV
jgi:hypothetical protein